MKTRYNDHTCRCYAVPVQAFDHPSIDSIATFLTESDLLPAAFTAQPAPDVPPSATAATEAAARTAALQLVTAADQDLLGPDSSRGLDPSAPLMSAGLNSTMAVTLAASIEAAVGNPVPPTLVSLAGCCFSTATVQPLLALSQSCKGIATCMLAPVTYRRLIVLSAGNMTVVQAFDHPSINSIATFLTESALLPAAAASQPVTSAPSTTSTAPTYPSAPAMPLVPAAPAHTHAPSSILVVASAFKAPGKSSPSRLFPWQQAASGASVDGSSVVPLSRWNVDLPLPSHMPGELQARFGCFLDGIEVFDPEAVGMTPAEALLVDPQQRLVMEAFGDVAAATTAAGLYSR